MGSRCGIACTWPVKALQRASVFPSGLQHRMLHVIEFATEKNILHLKSILEACFGWDELL